MSAWSGVWLVWAGVSAVLLGAVIGAALAPSGIDRRVAAFAGAASLMWAAIRWLVLRLSAPRLHAEDPAAMRDAFCVGLLVYALAFTPELRLAAWLVAGTLTALVLIRRGRRREEVVRAVGIAWSVQALVVASGWLARNVVIGILASRG